MKKILIISEPFYPQVAAIGQLLTDLSEDLVKAGFQVKVLPETRDILVEKIAKFQEKKFIRE